MLVLLASVSLPTFGRAALGDVVHSIPCAGANTADLAWVDGVLYQVILAPVEQKMIYRLDPADGAVLGTIPCAGTSPQGITYDGHNLWECDPAWMPVDCRQVCISFGWRSQENK